MKAWAEVTTIGDALVRADALHPSRDAVVFPDSRRTYRELLAGAFDRADALVKRGVQRGDRVGVFMPNCIEFAELVFASSLIGAVVVPINTRSRDVELSHIVRHAGIKVIACAPPVGAEPDLADIVSTSSEAANVEVITVVSSERDGVLASLDEIDRRRRRARIRDIAFLLYTSGTTSAPKGCLLSHEAIVRSAMARFEERDSGDGPIWTPCPLFHVGALVPLVGSVALMRPFVSCRQFDAEAALAVLQNERVAVALPLFPAFTDAMIDAPSFATGSFEHLRLILTTGAPRAVRQAQEAFAPAKLISAYGMTEMCGVASSSADIDSDEDRLRWDGTPFAGIELAIVDPETHDPRPTGEPGEIVARGYCLFDGYYRDPVSTSAAFDVEGWFHTGDIGVVDAVGHISFQGRFKDMLKVGGENVASLEVESFLCSHPSVRRAEVVGAPDARLEEVVAVFIELEPGSELTAAELIEFCTGKIARFKIPRHVVVISPDQWPMSATKIDKVALRAQVREIIAQGDTDE